MARRCLSTMCKKSMCCACYADDVRKETCEDDATLTKTGGERVHASSTVHGQAVKEGEARHAELPLGHDIVQGEEAAASRRGAAARAYGTQAQVSTTAHWSRRASDSEGSRR